ncbi:MAG: hypothetical protein H7068_12330, partial [Pedobacter sp.]|nr:hypothetical protein [Chitinophagaceae bacterium]
MVITDIEAVLEYKPLKKKELLLKEGQVNKHIYFIEKGSVKTYKTSLNDKDYISKIY